MEKHGEKPKSYKRTVEKYVTKAPEILVIRFNRFAQGEKDPVTGRIEELKITDPVPFEEHLNLGDYTESETPIFYQLQGVVGHNGKNVGNGHYIAGIREPLGRSFCSINDEVISRDQGGDVDELYNIRSLHADFNPYVLFYSKV